MAAWLDNAVCERVLIPATGLSIPRGEAIDVMINPSSDRLGWTEFSGVGSEAVSQAVWLGCKEVRGALETAIPHISTTAPGREHPIP